MHKNGNGAKTENKTLIKTAFLDTVKLRSFENK